ncbi:nucleobase-ascorbate transporter 7 [Striga asiatica]|uniref:Nucleobase-ascorbate transporter 7 n=1 Tax=Striga asiatica TaxID=4170 RepID=A0A5A7PXJ1_STRAF|nr:nucleobase-ascorbate transporter 7 [Striga asiatica]
MDSGLDECLSERLLIQGLNLRQKICLFSFEQTHFLEKSINFTPFRFKLPLDLLLRTLRKLGLQNDLPVLGFLQQVPQVIDFEKKILRRSCKRFSLAVNCLRVHLGSVYRAREVTNEGSFDPRIRDRRRLMIISLVRHVSASERRFFGLSCDVDYSGFGLFVA